MWISAMWTPRRTVRVVFLTGVSTIPSNKEGRKINKISITRFYLVFTFFNSASFFVFFFVLVVQIDEKKKGITVILLQKYWLG